MAPSCEHSDSLSDIHSVEYGGVDVESSTCDLSFRPGTKLSLVLTKKPQREAPRVKIAIEGSTENLRGKIWYPSEKDGEIDTTRWNVELNTEYRVPLALKHRVFCKVWTEECPLCKADAEQKAVHETQLQSLRSQLKQLENRLAEQRLQSENTQKVMESRIRQLEQAAVDNERKLKTVVDQNESLKKETEESAAKISELTAALAEETKARESVVATNVAAATLENELLRLDARIDSLKKRLAKQREGAENTQKQLRFRIRAMEEKAVAKKRNYGSILSALESKCGRLQEEAKIAAKSQAELEKEIKELKSALADEQTRFSALQQEHRAEIEAEREKRAGESAAKEFLMEEIGCMRSQVFNFKHEEEAERQNADDPQANAVSPSAVPADSWEPVDAK
ncbi:hypothetical protein M3Y99_00155900 [Aphelenchoides fujianensis]|nr:hypothetical protein M3Y99_00155900 [Aphelenchoides fujianensis]